MIKKELEKDRAIKLRRIGKTYSEILGVIPVAKSTLSIWLKDVGLAETQKQRFTELKRLASKRGGESKRKQRIYTQNLVIDKAKEEIKQISPNDLFLIGVVLYWAEGSKEKEYHPGSPLQFSNMDPRMIQVFLIWLLSTCKISKNMIVFNIFLHESHRGRQEEVKAHWAKVTRFPKKSFEKIYWKKNKLLKTNRKNTDENYFGVLKIKVRMSSGLVRKVSGWTDGIFEKIIKKM